MSRSVCIGGGGWGGEEEEKGKKKGINTMINAFKGYTFKKKFESRF